MRNFYFNTTLVFNLVRRIFWPHILLIFIAINALLVSNFTLAGGISTDLLSKNINQNIKNCVFSHCSPSPSVKTEDHPMFYPFYNDLTKKEGGFNNEFADKIILRGFIFDKECVPISDANVRIWQQDEYGNDRYIQKLSDDEKLSKLVKLQHSKVKGVGKATTDNNGLFFFRTVPPGKFNKTNNKDYINIAIYHAHFPNFDGKIILNQHKPPDDLISKKFIIAYLNNNVRHLYDQPVYDFYVTLDVQNRYRRY